MEKQILQMKVNLNKMDEMELRALIYKRHKSMHNSILLTIRTVKELKRKTKDTTELENLKLELVRYKSLIDLELKQ